MAPRAAGVGLHAGLLLYRKRSEDRYILAARTQYDVAGAPPGAGRRPCNLNAEEIVSVLNPVSATLRTLHQGIID